MPLRIRSWHPAVAGATLAASVLLVPISAVAADAQAGRRAATAATCRFARAPYLAARTSRDVRAALSYAPGGGPSGTHEARSDLWCAIEESRRHEAQSVVRVIVTETVLRKADDVRRRINDLKELDGRPVAPSSSSASSRRARPDDDADHPEHRYHDRLFRLVTITSRLLRRVYGRSAAEFGRVALWGLPGERVGARRESNR
ncbi:hypothetical protein [Streptomyces triticagri]|nr:hypothetical protein [Streptomyces triticagri]